jgi:sugar lactone lactonase YvrE
VRRLVIVCAAGMATFAAFAVARKDTASSATPIPPVVVARNIAARTLALAAHGAISSGATPGTIYVTNADQPNRIFTLAAGSQLVGVAGSGAAGSLGDGSAATSAELSLKLDSLDERSGVAVAADGTIFIADTLNSTIRRVASPSTSEPGIIRSVAGRWAPPQNVTLQAPMGIALDRAGNLYIADHAANAIFEMPDATSATPGQLELLAQVVSPASLAVTTGGNKVFVASPETGGVFSLDTATRTMQTISGFASQSSGCAASPAGNCPSGIAVDGGGNLFVADANSNQILRVDAKTVRITTAETSLHAPGEITIDASGNLFVANQATRQILEFPGIADGSGNLTLTIPGPPPAPPAPLTCPQGAAYNFCYEPLFGTSPVAIFTLTNTSSATITGIAFSITSTSSPAAADFTIQPSSCVPTLDANRSCSIIVAFTPTTSGVRTGTLSVTDSNPADTLTQDFTGTGDDYQLQLQTNAPQTIDVAPGQAAVYMFQVVPDGTYGGNISVVCPGNVPQATTCVSKPTTITITSGSTTPVPFTLTFQTTAANGTTVTTTIAALFAPAGGGRKGPTRALLVVLLCVALVATIILFAARMAFARRRRAASVRLPWPVVALGCAFFAMLGASCGGGAGKNNDVISTPKGDTTMLVQAVSQNATRPMTIYLDVD